MTKEEDTPKVEKRIVVSFDICSSTVILEDLHKTENINAWRNFLIRIKKYLSDESERLDFLIYKFTGDGWIILFNSDCPGDVVIPFLEDFCRFFKKQFADGVYDLLDSPPEVTGVRFGLDRGNLVRILMLGKPEYIGRPINVACRLQSAIKDKDRRPQYKALMTKHLYFHMKNDLSEYNCKEVNRTLRNIDGDKPVRCVKFNLLGG